MTTRRIQFRGNVTVCAKYLPFAKDRLTLLSKLYKRRFWTREYVIQGTRVTIERNGPIQFIRIIALSGYEFSTNLSVTLVPGLPPPEEFDNADFSIMVPGKVDDPENDETPDDLPKIDGLIVRNRNGVKLTPENADNSVVAPNDSIDNRDRWLYGGRYGVVGTEEPDEPFFLGYFQWSTTQWFEMPVPADDEFGDAEAALLVDGTTRKRMMMWWAWRPRHVNLASWAEALNPVIPGPGIGISIGAGGTSRLTYLSVANSSREFRIGQDGEQNYTHAPLAGPSARQGQFMVAASWRGDDFAFEVRNEQYQGFDYAFSTFFSFTKPAWAFGEVMTPWYWRGDGKRCVSLQYGRTEADGPTDEIIDCGFVEADVVAFDAPDDNGKPIIDTDLSGFHKTQHNLMAMGIFPVGIDYVLHDQRKKRAYYLKHYLGPVRSSAIPITDEPRYYRDILIYLVCTILEDDDTYSGLFPGTEQWKIPIWHDSFLVGSSPASLSGESRTSVGSEMFDAAQLAIHPYRNIRGVITAMDCRAEAIAVKYRCMMTYPHSIDGNDLASAPHFGKYWGIWGKDGDPDTHDVRQNTWISPNIATGYSIPNNDHTSGFNPGYEWFNADPSVWEDADPPEADPTLPPGDFFNYLNLPPAGYALYTTSHPAYNTDGATATLRDIHGIIVGIFPYLGGGPGNFSPFRSYNHFSISPTRSFSLSVSVRSNHDYVDALRRYESNPYGVPNPWNLFDYIEKNLGRGDFDANGEPVPEGEEGTGVFEVLTETHVGLYNSSRGLDLEWLVVPEESPEGDDLFNAAALMAVWVE